MAKAPVDIQLNVDGLSDLQKLERRMEALEKEVTRLGKGLPRATNNVRNFGRASRGASGGVKALGTAVKSALGPLLAVAAAVGSLTAAFRTIAGQDFALAKVRSLGVDSVALAKELKQVSAELEGNASVAELTGAAYDVASAGFTNAAEAAAILKAASLGATGGFTDINTVADAATSVLNAYGKSARDAGLIVDQFIQTQNDGKIVVAEYAANISKVAPVASALGIELAEVNAVIAQVTAGGTKAEVAFTGLKTALAQLASGNANKALAEIGIEITEADIASEGLIGVLKKIKESGIDVGTAFKAFGTEAGPVLQAVFNDLEKTERLLENQENAAGAAARAQQEAANTINGAWNRVLVSITNLFSDQAALAQAIIPILDAVASAVDGITEATEGFKQVAIAVNGLIDSLSTKFGALSEMFVGLGNNIKWAADQLGNLILRADGFSDPQVQEIMRINDYDKSQGAGFDFDKIQQIQTQVQQKTKTDVPDFAPKLSGGSSEVADSSTKAADEMERQLKAGEDLSRQFSRQIKLLQTKGKFDKKLLQNQFEFEDQVRRINETAAPLQQEGLISQAAAAKNLEDIKVLTEAAEAFGTEMGENAADGIKKLNTELTDSEQLVKGTYDIIAGTLTDSIEGLINGTKEWGDVLSDIAGQLGKMFLQAGFNGLGGALKIPGMFADGGRPPTGEVSIVGERGPELFVPDTAGTVVSNEQSKAALDTYSGGNSAAAAPAGPVKAEVTYKGPTLNFNGNDYIPRSEASSLVAEGAKQGKTLAMKQLQNSRSQRARLGL